MLLQSGSADPILISDYKENKPSQPKYLSEISATPLLKGNSPICCPKPGKSLMSTCLQTVTLAGREALLSLNSRMPMRLAPASKNSMSTKWMVASSTSIWPRIGRGGLQASAQVQGRVVVAIVSVVAVVVLVPEADLRGPKAAGEVNEVRSAAFRFRGGEIFRGAGFQLPRHTMALSIGDDIGSQARGGAVGLKPISVKRVMSRERST